MAALEAEWENWVADVQDLLGTCSTWGYPFDEQLNANLHVTTVASMTTGWLAKQMSGLFHWFKWLDCLVCCPPVAKLRLGVCFHDRHHSFALNFWGLLQI